MIRRDLLQKVLGESVIPRDISIYTEAFVHKSASKTYGISQERLEHLGDAVLSLCVCHLLYERYPTHTEGTLTKMRTRLVNGKTLAFLGRAMGIDEILILDPVASSALEHDRVFEDTFEAIVGAIYLDQGIDAAKSFVSHQIDHHIKPDAVLEDSNYKDMVRKEASRRGLQLPSYTSELVDGTFHCLLQIGDIISTRGQGQTKRAAEMSAAQQCIFENFTDIQKKNIF